MGYISLHSNLNAIIGITSYYYVILQVVVLHDAIKTIQNGVFVLFQKKQKPVSFKKNKKRIKKTQKNRRVGYFKKRVFLNPDNLSIFFCYFPLIARSRASHATIGLIGRAPHTQSKSPW